MGYYSDVALALSANAATKLKIYMNCIPKDIFDINTIFFPDKHIQDRSGAEFFYWSSIKWYREFPEIQSLEQFIASLDFKDFLFCRIGESCGDIEELGGFLDNPFDVGINCRITFCEAKA